MHKVTITALFFALCFSLHAQLRKELDFEETLATIETLTYDVNSFDSAYELADEMISKAKTDEEKGMANFAKAEVIVKNGWGYYLGEYGVPYLEEAINYLAKSQNRELLSQAFNTLSVSFITKYNPNNELTSTRELEYLRMALSIKNDSAYQLPLPFIVKLKDRNANEDDVKSTIKSVSEDLNLAIRSNDLARQMYRTEKLGYLYWQLDGGLQRSESYLLKAAEMASAKNDQIFLSICLSQLTVYANRAKDFQKALEYGLKGLKHSEEHSLRFRESIFRDQLYLTYKALNRPEEAIFHKAIAIELEEQIQSETHPKRQKMVVDRIKALEYQNELENSLKEKTNRLNYIYSGIAVLLLVILGVLYSNYQLRKRNKLISEASLTGQSIERKRLAADLHDNLGSTISSIQWSLDAINLSAMSSSQQSVFKNLREQLQKAYGDIRLLSHNLLPLVLEESGLEGALRQLLHKMNKNPKVHFHLEVDKELGRLEKKLEFELYCICMELYNNIMNHSNASEATTILKRLNNQLILEVSDNGKGFKNDEKEGMGLKNIRERVKAVKGQIYISSSEGGGVLTRIELNLTRQNHDNGSVI